MTRTAVGEVEAHHESDPMANWRLNVGEGRCMYSRHLAHCALLVEEERRRWATQVQVIMARGPTAGPGHVLNGMHPWMSIIIDHEQVSVCTGQHMSAGRFA